MDQEEYGELDKNSAFDEWEMSKAQNIEYYNYIIGIDLSMAL